MRHWLLLLVLSSACRDVYVLATPGETNARPLAQAGTGATVRIGTTVDVDGSGSFDPDGVLVSHTWELLHAPAGSTAGLSSTMTSSSSFVPDVVGTYYVALTVRDDDGATARDEVMFEAAALPLTEVTVDAGADTTIGWLARGQVTGSASATAGFTPTVTWTMTARPFYSTATLVNAATLTPSFVADAQGTYTLQLTATAGGVTVNDVVQVTAFTEGKSIGEPQFAEPTSVTYSAALDRLIIVSNFPAAISVVDPVTGLGPTLALPVTQEYAFTIALHPSGLRAAIGGADEIVIVNVQTVSVEQVFDGITADKLLVFAPDNRVHSAPGPGEDIVTLNVSTGAIAGVAPFGLVHGMAMRPNGAEMYVVDGQASAIARYNIASTPIALQRQAASPSLTGGLYVTADGASIVTGRGIVLRSTNNATTDMTVRGSLPMVLVESLAQSSVTQEIAVVDQMPTPHRIRWFNETTLAPRFVAPFVDPGQNHFWEAFVAYRADGQRMYIVGGRASEWAVYTVSPPP